MTWASVPKFVIISFHLDLRILIFTFNLVLINAASCYLKLCVNTLLCIWINQRWSDSKVSTSFKTQLHEIGIELDLKVPASFKIQLRAISIKLEIKVPASLKTQLHVISIKLDFKVSASFKTNKILWVPINFGKMGATLPLGFPLPPLFVRKGLLT